MEGQGWLLYDSALRQQITCFDTVDSSKINQSLYSTTFLPYGAGAKFCPECMIADHSAGAVHIAPQPRTASGADAGSTEGWKIGATLQTFRWL